MSTLKATTLEATTLLHSDGTSTTQPSIPALETRFAKAWVNFSQSTNTIRDSENISSLTDIAAGNTNVNFTIAMNDALYATAVMGVPSVVHLHNHTYCWLNTTTYIRAVHWENNAAVDTVALNVVVLGGQ